MAKFTMIDNHSGYVWECAEGESPADACRAMDAKITGDRDGGEYAEHGPGYRPACNDSGYWVYPGDISEDADGQDPELIAEVEARGCVAYVEYVGENKYA